MIVSVYRAFILLLLFIFLERVNTRRCYEQYKRRIARARELAMSAAAVRSLLTGWRRHDAASGRTHAREMTIVVIFYTWRAKSRAHLEALHDDCRRHRA